MSGPKYYTFPAGSPEEAAGILSKFSAFQWGVSATVSGNEIKVTVSNAAWCAGKDYSYISEQISQAKERFREDEEMKRMLENAKNDEVHRVGDIKTRISKEADSKRKKLTDALGRSTVLCRESNVSFNTPFGVYSLSDCTERAEKLVQQIDSEIGSIAAERDKCLSNCDSYSASVRSATSLNELSRIQRNAPDLTIEGTYIDRNVDSLEQEIKEKKKQLTAFVHFLGELDNAISTKGLSQYKQRITDKISSVDIYSPSSIQEILQLVEQVEREHTYLQEQLRIKQAGEAAEREVSYQIATLKQLKSLLKPLADNAEKSVETQIEYERIGKQAISECEQIIEEVLGLDFCSAIHFKALEKIKSVIDRARGSLRSPNVYAQLTATLTQLRGIQAECIKEAESYTKFSVELDKYKELYMKLRGMLSAGGSKLIDEDGFIENPANIDFAYSDDEQQIAMLADRNAQLESIINQSVQHTFCAGMSAILHKSSWGTEFKREKRADDSVHLSYVRKADKGAIFDVSCGANGEIAIVPKGVILSNGHATISAAELRSVHSSCAWADEINQTFEGIGIPSGSYEEMDAAEKEKLYDKKNYYKIETDEESIRFLRMSGYSDEEIEKMGYTVRGVEVEDEEETSQKSNRQVANAIEIKPKK